MALAERAVWKQYEKGSPFDLESSNGHDYLSRKAKANGGRLVFPVRQGQWSNKRDGELLKIALQSRRLVTDASVMPSNRPSISRWIAVSVDLVGLISLAISVTAFFVFLLELSAGRPAFLVPSFSAFFIFSVVGVVAIRLRSSIRFMQSDAQPQ